MTRFRTPNHGVLSRTKNDTTLGRSTERKCSRCGLSSDQRMILQRRRWTWRLSTAGIVSELPTCVVLEQDVVEGHIVGAGDVGEVGVGVDHHGGTSLVKEAEQL